MTYEDFAEVIEKACEKANLNPKRMPKLVSDRGPALISKELSGYLKERGIKQILASPYHPQTNGKIERYHKSLEHKVMLNIYDCPNELKKEIGMFISSYNRNRYHESLGNVTPNDVYYGRRDQIIKERKDKKRMTIMRRKNCNKLELEPMRC